MKRKMEKQDLKRLINNLNFNSYILRNDFYTDDLSIDQFNFSVINIYNIIKILKNKDFSHLLKKEVKIN